MTEDKRICRHQGRTKNREREQNHCLEVYHERKELQQKQSTESLSEEQGEFKSALVSLQQSTNAEGKAFAIYTCSPFAILVGVLHSAFIIIETHKVLDDVR